MASEGGVSRLVPGAKHDARQVLSCLIYVLPDLLPIFVLAVTSSAGAVCYPLRRCARSKRCSAYVEHDCSDNGPAEINYGTQQAYCAVKILFGLDIGSSFIAFFFGLYFSDAVLATFATFT
ncbi:hypothetical protein DFH06DRAFT_1328502 [Mycena polygramma]|nr:hypothetical protein DFH06DRAFT_1328502 [Mycena polygramma]